MRIDEKRSFGKWWLCAGCAGFSLASFFIAATLLLGEIEQPANRPPRFRSVVTQRLPRPTTTEPSTTSSPTTTTTTTTKITPTEPVLDSGPDPMSLDDLFPRQNSIRKKSEAVFPLDWTDDGHPIVGSKSKHDFRLPLDGPEHREYEYAESDENPMFLLLQKRLKDVYEFVGANKFVDWLDLVDSVNKSVHNRDVTYVVERLKTFLSNSSSSELSLSSLIYPSRESLASNSSSLVSFGLLAIDLFLLHNVQQIALSDDDPTARNLLSSDPEVTALNALFVPPDVSSKNGKGRSRQSIEDDDDDEDDNDNDDLLSELADFAKGALAGAVNLGRAYKRTTAAVRGRSAEPSPLDCIWTLYCRNLDKTATLPGPYGFLAKMNGLGLRLMMGEFPIEKALDKLLHEFTKGWSHIECQKLFPRCSAEEAKTVVMETAVGNKI